MRTKPGRINPDLKLCVILGEEDDPIQTAEAVLAGGARFLQYRGKGKSGARQIKEATALRGLSRRYGACLVVNDRIDIALLADAEGVHLGGEDLPIASARRILGAGKIIGATAHSLEEAEQAEKEEADYIGFGAVAATQSKTGVSVTGLDPLRDVVCRVQLPVFAIGGISGRNVRQVLQAGAAGAAVLSAVSSAENSTAATRELLDLMH